MKHIFIFLSSIILFCSNLSSQNNIEKIITEVEKNNIMLVALRKNADAELIGNKTGLYLKNPEFAFNYLWGSPVSIGNRKDISFLQSFDFPSAYAYRNQISDYQNVQVELDYKKQHKSIIMHLRLVCNDLIYHNALKAELTKRIANAQNIANSYKLNFDIGGVSIIDYNKAQLNLLNITKDAETIDIGRNALLAELKNLNGGIFVEFTDSVFPVQPVAPDFEQWYAEAEQNNPVLQWLKQEVTISQKNEKLYTALSMPKFQAGFMSETIVGQQFQGVTIGLSIPLLENKNAVKYAKARTLAIQSTEANNKMQYYNDLKMLHTKAISLQNSLTDYRENLKLFNSFLLLQKAFDKGELSLIEYLYELSISYESIGKILELDRNLNNTIVELNKYQ